MNPASSAYSIRYCPLSSRTHLLNRFFMSLHSSLTLSDHPTVNPGPAGTSPPSLRVACDVRVPMMSICSQHQYLAYDTDSLRPALHSLASAVAGRLCARTRDFPAGPNRRKLTFEWTRPTSRS